MATTTPARTDDELMLDRVEAALDGIRPYIESHRGWVEVVDYDAADGKLLLRLGGSCQGCAAASITLKHGIEVRLREAVPEVREIVSV